MRSSMDHLSLANPENTLVLSPRVSDMAVASAKRRLDKKLSGEGSPTTLGLRQSAPASMQSMSELGNRPSLMVPPNDGIGLRESQVKRDRPPSTRNFAPSPESKRFSMSDMPMSDMPFVQTQTDLHAAAQTLLEKRPKQRRWMNRKAPPRKWTPEEDAMLSAAVKEHGAKNWKHISQFVPNRNHTQCLQRWGKVLAPNLKKGHWTGDEDQLLMMLVKELAKDGQVKNWGEVAGRIQGRTSKQCRERWYNHLDPSIKRGNYTVEEDAVILEEQKRIGNRWSIISAKLPGRTEDAVKIRWKTLKRMLDGGGKATQRKPRKQRQQQQQAPVVATALDPSVVSHHYANVVPASGIVVAGGMVDPSFMGMRASASTFMKPPSPAGDLGNPFFNFNPPVLNTALPDELDPFSFRTSDMSTGLGAGLGLGLTPTGATPGAVLSSAEKGPAFKIDEQPQHRAPGQKFGQKFRAQSLEWLEEALLSPSQQAAQLAAQQAQQQAQQRQRPAALKTQSSRDSASNFNLEGSMPSVLGGLTLSGSGCNNNASQEVKSRSPGLTPKGFDVSMGLTPTAAAPPPPPSRSLGAPVRKQSSIKDEDLDHFLIDMDLEQLGASMEERLSFTVDDTTAA